MGDVIPLGNVTIENTPVDNVLDAAKLKISGDAVVLGYDKGGNFRAISSLSDGGDVLWLLEMCKKRLLEIGGGEE